MKFAAGYSRLDRAPHRSANAPRNVQLGLAVLDAAHDTWRELRRADLV